MKSESHLDKFTGIYDMKDVPICNGDKIQVHDKGWSKTPIIGTVIWKKENYEFKGNNQCAYNIYAWKHSIEVLETNRESVYELNTLEEALKIWEQKNLSFLITDRKLIRQAFKDAFLIATEQNKLNEN